MLIEVLLGALNQVIYCVHIYVLSLYNYLD